MGNRRREAVGVRRLAGAFDGNLPTPTTSTPLSLAPWAIEGAKRLECAGLPALSTVISYPHNLNPSVVGIMGNRRREAFGVRRLVGPFDGNLPTPTTSTPLSLASWAIEGAKRLECAGLPALSTVISLPPQPQTPCRWPHG